MIIFHAFQLSFRINIKHITFQQFRGKSRQFFLKQLNVVNPVKFQNPTKASVYNMQYNGRLSSFFFETPSRF